MAHPGRKLTGYHRDAECRRIYVNPALCTTLGCDITAVIGKKPSEFPGGQEYDLYESKIRKVFATGKDAEFELTVKAEKEICNLIRLTAERDLSGSIKTVMGVGRNISELNTQRQHTSRMAFYDQLTSLPNRRLLIDRLQHALTSSAHNGLHGALIFIDLDNFKTLNDTLGHGIGDLLLKQVAQRLISCVRQEDTVARVGGDEFVIVLENLGKQIQQAAFQLEVLAEKILATLNQPYHLADYDRQSTPSIGIVMFSGDQISIDDLMKRADIAMYQAKKVGRNSIRFFDLDMQAAVEMRSSLEEAMKRALPQQQFMLLYQAQTDDTGKIVGTEVLLRWQHPTNGLILPDDFIHIAEETGLIVPIGLWVLKSACHQLKTWEQEPGKDHLHIAVNVSARQFQQADFVEQIIGILKSTDINPARLTLELTESMVLDSTPETIRKMQVLKKTGLKFAMDDFGTGHSSLSSLKKLPLDQLKIDRMFIRDITENNDAAIIVQTIIAMAHNLCMEVIAEGVETKMQKDFLIQHHCVNFQGYFFGKPMPIKEFEQALSQNLSYRRSENVLDNGSRFV
jgi:diguanylate cyclase (GGDEF)-like protein